jgi:hypothetical protein
MEEQTELGIFFLWRRMDDQSRSAKRIKILHAPHRSIHPYHRSRTRTYGTTYYSPCVGVDRTILRTLKLAPSSGYPSCSSFVDNHLSNTHATIISETVMSRVRRQKRAMRRFFLCLFFHKSLPRTNLKPTPSNPFFY